MQTIFSTTVNVCLIVLVMAVLLASIHPLEFASYVLHQVGTLLSVLILFWYRKKAAVSDSAFIGATLFLLIHIVGARYLYSYVPYSDWTQAAFGFSLDAVMGWQRNMYDRLVHFCYGLLLFGYVYEVIHYYFPYSSRRQLIVVALMANMSSSLIYEWLEWLLAMGLSPEQAEAYNGQQGDMWDAHKDMLLALLGGMLGVVVFAKRYPKAC